MMLEERIVSETLTVEDNELIVKEADSSFVGYTFGTYVVAAVALGLIVKAYRYFRRNKWN